MKQQKRIIKNFFIKTFGCTFNFGDSMKIETLLRKQKYNKVNDIQSSDIIIINTCAVKHATETKILHYIFDIRKQYPDKRMIVTGCLPQIGKKMHQKIKSQIHHDDLILKPTEIHNIILSMGESLKSDEILYKPEIIPAPFKNGNIGIIQISEGCNNSCTYCCTTIARGKLISFNPKMILNQIKSLYLEGINNFFLTSQDLGNYNYSGYTLVDLLTDISDIQGNFQIRLGMLNPDYLIGKIDQFLKIFHDKRFYRFIHIPIQSGSNHILQLMRRNYKIEEIEQIIKKFKKFDSNFTFSTDIIVGFPSETITDFQESVNFINQWKPFVLNISKYSARPNTIAKKMKQLPSQEIKRRSKFLDEIYRQYSHILRMNWIGWKGKVFVSDSNDIRSINKGFLTRNLYNIPIFIESGRIGTVSQVKIVKIKGNKIIGKIT
ncbi:tRNA (N(6)-L-threonylcarbamoyladenosine(37)-C(2))-methylthiotransferase [Candidatus Harpocratesius sp.]